VVINLINQTVIGKKKDIKHVAVAGNIGAGKTTLTEMLAKHYGWEPRYEDVENNPYLNDFYQDMPRWSFNLQVFFLNSRLQQIVEIQQGSQTVIQDRTIYEDAHIFAPNLHEMGLMSTRDFENYINLFRTICKQVQPPDLLVYLKSSLSTLVNQIERRGRPYEDNIRLDYLKQLNQYYNNWIENYKEGPLLILPVDDLNFADKPEDFGKVVEKINAELYGLF
jgi:deoxyadenosine/deoxycytidine kinase